MKSASKVPKFLWGGPVLEETQIKAAILFLRMSLIHITFRWHILYVVLDIYIYPIKNRACTPAPPPAPDPAPPSRLW